MSSIFLNPNKLTRDKFSENLSTRSVSQRLLTENVHLIECIKYYQSKGQLRKALLLQFGLKRNLEFLSTIVRSDKEIMSQDMMPYHTVEYKVRNNTKKNSAESEDNLDSNNL